MNVKNWVKKHKKATIGGVVAGAIIGGIGYGIYSLTKKKKNDDNKSSTDNSSASSSSDSSSDKSSSSSSKTSSSSSTVNKQKVKHEQSKIEKPTEIYSQPKQMSVQRAGLEVYKTDEEKYTQYISPSNEKAVDMTEVEVETDSDSGDSANVFKLHKGQIQETYYYTDLMSINFDTDYADMNQSGTINRESVNLHQFYKGVRICLLSAWEEPLKTLSWDEFGVALEGFITEQTFKEKNVDIKVEGYTKLLEQQIPFKFQQMYRSEILREIILSAGLQPYINATGLDDDITDFTNEVKTKKNSTSNKPIGESNAVVSKLAQEICQGKTTDRDKAQAIHSYIARHIQYPSPNYSDHHRCPVKVLQTGISNCCDRARLGHEMANAVGLHNRGVHGPGHVWIQYKINGKWVNSDPSSSRPKLGAIYNGLSVDSMWTFEKCN